MPSPRELVRAPAESPVRDELITRVVHDVRTPIGAILTWLELLKGYSTDPQARRAVEMAQQSARDLTEIVAGVEDAQRLVAGTLELQMAPVDLTGLLEEVADRVRPAAHSRGIVLDCDLSPAVTLARGDGRRLRHLFTRLLFHCTSLSRPGTVRLQSQAGEAETRIQIVCPELILSASLQQALIAERPWPCVEGPSGQAMLDFATAGRVIRLHGGRLEAESSNGSGSRLSAALPLA